MRNKVVRRQIENRLANGESLRSIARSIGMTYQSLQYHRRKWGAKLLRSARTSGCNHASWRGGYYIDQWGYKMVLSPRKGRANPYVPEHILVAEKMIGRVLLRSEVVHHINGVKDDNRPENLLVLTRIEHKKLHAQLEAIAFCLLRSGLIEFANGSYQLATRI